VELPARRANAKKPLAPLAAPRYAWSDTDFLGCCLSHAAPRIHTATECAPESNAKWTHPNGSMDVHHADATIPARDCDQVARM